MCLRKGSGLPNSATETAEAGTVTLLTSTRPELKSAAGWLASATLEVVEAFLHDLSDHALMALPWLFEFWALPHQMPPDGMWKT